MSDKSTENRAASEVEQSQQAQKVMSPGAQLAAYRQDRGWSIEQVASQLNLAPRQIVAIESDDYPALPGVSIVRGFIRAYAKLLKVDAEPLLAMVGGETVFTNQPMSPRQTLSTPFAEARLPSMGQRTGGGFKKWLLGILLLLLVGLLLWGMRQKSGEMAQMSEVISAPIVNEQADTVSGEVAVPETAESSTPSDQIAGDLPSQESVPASPAPDASIGPSTSAAEQEVLPPTPAVTGSEAADPKKQAGSVSNTLLLEMREGSWIEVRRASDDSVLVGRLASAGESEQIEVNEPVSIVIGNAAGVDAHWHGEVLELKAKARSNVARLNLK